MKIVSYNINGIRAANRLNILDWMKKLDADIYCFQEMRADEKTCKSILEDSGYLEVYNCGQRAGYSGTAILSKIIPNKIEVGMGEKDPEGRTMAMFFDKAVIVNSYVPNGLTRLDYKLEYFDKLTDYITKIAKDFAVILCSDTNIAHSELDVSHPKETGARSGFLPIEREKLSKMLENGFVDTYRKTHPDNKMFSWRSYRSRTVGGDFGWKFRFDYIITNKEQVEKIKRVDIHDLEFSDHLPVIADLDIDFANRDKLKKFTPTQKQVKPEQLKLFD